MLLFKQIIIFSEQLRKGFITLGNLFKRNIKMNYLVLENMDKDPCKSVLMNRETSQQVIL